MSSHVIDYYKKHSNFTNFNDNSDVFNLISKDIYDICIKTFDIIIADFLVNFKVYSLPKESKEDISVRDVDSKIKIFKERINSNPNLRILGNCRDLSLILCSVFREKDIPARVRSGFATYFSKNKKYDHWLCEYWNEKRQCWTLIDPWMFQISEEIDKLPRMFSNGLKKLNLDPLDVDRNFFISGAEAWMKCKCMEDKAINYGTYEKKLKGYWFIRDNMIRDLFCLNKLESLPWDCWGNMGKVNREIDNDQNILIDKLAKTLYKDNISLKELFDLTQDFGLADFEEKYL